jgi:hypothetical protein
VKTAKDARGTYQVLARWVDAWADQVAGWCVCELRRYEDGAQMVHRGMPQYVGDSTADKAAMHSIYLQAQAALMRAAK